jgi:hypothetical protein
VESEEDDENQWQESADPLKDMTMATSNKKLKKL